ncbi:MAG: glycosyltransferase [Chitinophagaceae bacterium]|nr:glycosyltransferase [Chitinophagaceae bacterium]
MLKAFFIPGFTLFLPGTKLLVLGEGSEKDNCMQQVARLGLQNHVAFLGFKTHPYSYISHSDVIILPSLFEPFGLVYIEALALKVPVVAFNTPAANEIIENNETGLLVDKGDHKALAEKIIYLLSNPAERNNIAERAYAKYKSHFTTGVMIQKQLPGTPPPLPPPPPPLSLGNRSFILFLMGDDFLPAKNYINTIIIYTGNTFLFARPSIYLL